MSDPIARSKIRLQLQTGGEPEPRPLPLLRWRLVPLASDCAAAERASEPVAPPSPEDAK